MTPEGMSCEELREDYGAWALGILGEPERTTIAEHLARNCPNCVPGVRQAMLTVTKLSGAVEMKDPPKRLRKRVLALARPESSRSWAAILIPWAVAGALAIVLMSVVLPMRRQSAATERLEQAMSILNDPQTNNVSFGDPKARGRVFVSPQKGVVFLAANLPRIDDAHTFQLWIIPATAGANPISAGIFDSAPDSTAVYVRPGPVTGAAALAVTVEPLGGSPQPTTTPFIVAKL